MALFIDVGPAHTCQGDQLGEGRRDEVLEPGRASAGRLREILRQLIRATGIQHPLFVIPAPGTPDPDPTQRSVPR